MDIIDLAEVLAEDFEDIQFKRIDGSYCLLLPIEEQSKLKEWLSEHKMVNVNLSFRKDKVKLVVS